MKAKKTILVVEDFPSIRRFLCEILQKNGYDTFDAANGMAAYELLTDHHHEINLVLTDYIMPDVNGYDLLVKLKENNNTKEIPIIFFTTETNPELIYKAKQAGLAAWIKKPYRSAVFFDQIKRVIDNDRGRYNTDLNSVI